MARKQPEDYDWLNDPFDEKKSAEEQAAAHMSNSAKVGLGCGCVVIILAVMVLIVVGAVGFLSVLN